MLLLFIKTGLINTIPKKFLLSSIWSLIFLQSNSGKRETLWTEIGKTFVSYFAIFFSIKSLWERTVDSHFRCVLAASKEKCGSAKSDVLKVFFPDIGKITNHQRGRPPTLYCSATELVIIIYYYQC